ncbi:hypothetical protein L6452_18349 [Arctium lappa]|uniref:Uncharacterized protein n=1 Tax=Arctium lappa TaxID=4217 RepID=A0ACB9C5Z7_ARCLA|nr:hypothetical protein L6452_18349 [Arctium lappa]
MPSLSLTRIVFALLDETHGGSFCVVIHFATLLGLPRSTHRVFTNATSFAPLLPQVEVDQETIFLTILALPFQTDFDPTQVSLMALVLISFLSLQIECLGLKKTNGAQPGLYRRHHHPSPDSIPSNALFLPALPPPDRSLIGLSMMRFWGYSTLKTPSNESKRHDDVRFPTDLTTFIRIFGL